LRSASGSRYCVRKEQIFFGLGFPPAWYQPISVGAFTKGLGFEQFWPNLVVLAGFFLLYLVAAQLILRKQEK